MVNSNNTFNYQFFIAQAFSFSRMFRLNGVLYRYIDYCRDFSDEEVTYLDGTKKIESVSHGIVVAENVNRKKLVCLDMRKYGDKEVVLL